MEKCEICMSREVFTSLCERCFNDGEDDARERHQADIDAAVAAERERCAKIADEAVDILSEENVAMKGDFDALALGLGGINAAKEIAGRIRSRGAGGVPK